MGTVKIKRIYEPAEKADGIRILVDRLWPRGMKKEVAQLDEWLKAVAPSEELRKWYHQDADHSKWPEFKARYLTELRSNEAIAHLKDIIEENKTITLLYAAHDQQQNHALVLLEFLQK